MDVFRASECAFIATNLGQRVRTLEIPTNAPVQTHHMEVEASSGTFTFPEDSQFSDRFIVWRASGTSLILEERSVSRTIRDGCIAFNFSRAPIVPGTSLSLIGNVFSLIVTTQSSIHRFSCRLHLDPNEEDKEPCEAALAQLLDVLVHKDILRHDAHDVHLLAARGVPTRAAVASRYSRTRVAVVIGDGQLVIVTLPNGLNSKSEEVVVSEGGYLFNLGRQKSGVLDVCACQEPKRPDGGIDVTNYTAFYTLNRDGTVRIVNGETYQTAFSDSFTNLLVNLDDGNEVTDASIRWNHCGNMALITVALTTKDKVNYILLRDVERQLLKVSETQSTRDGRLIDFGVHIPLEDEHIARLWTVVSSRTATHAADASDVQADAYRLQYTNLQLPSADARVRPTLAVSVWIPVRGVEEREIESSRRRRVRGESESSTITSSTVSESAESIKKTVFNVENHSFDVVLRAVKITSESPQASSIVGNDWNGLVAFVDGYLRSPEFNHKFLSNEWNRTTRVVSAHDTHAEGELRFYRAVRSSCTEIERSLRGAMGLLIFTIKGSNLVGVIQQSRLTIVLDSCSSLIDCLNGQQKEALEEALETAAAIKYRDADDDDDIDGEMSDDANPDASMMSTRSAVKRSKKGAAFVMEEDNPNETFVREAVEIFIRKAALMEKEQIRREVDEDSSSDEMEEGSTPSKSSSTMSSSSGDISDGGAQTYGGSFTSGLISSLLRLRVRDAHSIASGLMKLAHDSRHSHLNVFYERLKSIRNALRVLANQLDVVIDRECGGYISLSGWLFSSSPFSSVRLLRMEGGEEGGVMGMTNDGGLPEYRAYVDRSVLAIMCALYPTSLIQSLPKMLTAREKFDTLKAIFALWGTQAPASLQHVIAFYQGVAYAGTGMPRKALALFMKCARGMRSGDPAIRRALLPLGLTRERRCVEESEMSIGRFYVTAIKLLNDHGHQQEVIEMSREAMSKLPQGDHLSSINATLFKRQVDGEQWMEALSTIEEARDTSLRRQFMHDLLARLISVGHWQTIVESNFGSLRGMVESILTNHARSVDASSCNPHPFELVAAFHTRNQNFVSAAMAHYELSVNLRSSSLNGEIIMRWKNALTATVNLLQLVPKQKRFLAFPHQVEFSSGVRRTMLVVNEEELNREWIMLRGRCALWEAVNTSVPPDEPRPLIVALAKARLYSVALELCRHLNEDPSPVIADATAAAIGVDAAGLYVMPAWVAANRRHMHKKEKSEHWSVVRGLVKEARQRWPKDTRCLKAATTSFLKYGMPVAYWLHRKYSSNDASEYARVLLDYDEIDTAITVLTQCYQAAGDSMKSVNARVLPPHIVAEETIMHAESDPNPERKMLLDKLEAAVRTCQQRATNFTQAAKF